VTHAPVLSSPRRAARAIVAVLLAGVAALLGAPTATALLSAATPAATADDPSAMTWGVVPGDTAQGTGRANFAYDAAPGDTIQDSVVITNHGAAPLALDVYAADARTTTSGQLDLLTAAETSVDLGAWISLDLPAVTLDPGASVEVPFTVRIPADALPGDHSGGVITASVGADDGSTVRLDRRLALRVHLRVAGATRSAPPPSWCATGSPTPATPASSRRTSSPCPVPSGRAPPWTPPAATRSRCCPDPPWSARSSCATCAP
jgi:hypothetical protein